MLLKPNWNGCQLAGSTSVAVVQAACRWAHDQGAGEVIVGEGPVPVGRQRIAEYLDELGVPGCLDEVGARFVLFDDDEHVTYRDLPGLLAGYTFSTVLETPIRKAVHGDSSGVRGAAWLWKDG